MPFVKTTWIDGGAPGITAAALNNIENAIDSEMLYPTAAGTGTVITVTAYHFSLATGASLTFVASAANAAAATTLNVNSLGAKNLYKPGGTVAPNLIVGKAYTVWYNGTSFFIKASAEGDAIAADVLVGKIFSNDSDTGVTGTMTNVGAQTVAITTKAQAVVPSAGYHSGAGSIAIAAAEQAKVIAGNIKLGVTILGIAGSAERAWLQSTGRVTTNASAVFQITGLLFTPKLVIMRTVVDSDLKTVENIGYWVLSDNSSFRTDFSAYITASYGTITINQLFYANIAVDYAVYGA